VQSCYRSRICNLQRLHNFLLSPTVKQRKRCRLEKIVINTSCDAFCLSHDAFLRLRELGQPDALKETDQATYWPAAGDPDNPNVNQCLRKIPRNDRRLVQVVEELRSQANGHGAELKVVTIPDGVQWVIERKDGGEQVSEQHRICS
jgi:hypothetical protein